MLLRALSIIALFAGLGACQDTAMKSQAQRSETSSVDSKDTGTIKDDEKVDPPNNISGAYLHCVVESQPTDATPEALIGCRFDNAAGNRIPAASLAASATFTYKALPDKRIQVYAKQLQGDARYDAAYLFFGPDRLTLANAIQQTQVFVQLKAANATGADLLLGDRIVDIERDKNSIPEAPNTNYQTVRDNILTEAQQGQVTPPLP